MARSVVVTVPHRSSRGDILARLRTHLPQIKAKAAPYVSSIEDRWEGDELAFAVAAAGQRIAGRLRVEEEVVRLEIELPAILAAVAGPVRRRIEAEAVKLLARP
jgi:hypothetical protein